MLDRYVRENIIALEVFADDGQSEFNGVDGRTLHAFARRGLCGSRSLATTSETSDTGAE